ncbi:MAG: ComEC/Rec2 family competence protein [Pirellulaceae bacterium]
MDKDRASFQTNRVQHRAGRPHELWIWCLGLPLVWYHFHIVSPVSIIANVILWIPLTVALISGLLTAVLEASGYRSGTGRDRCANGHCSRSLGSSNRWRPSMAYFWLPSPPGWLVFTFYAGIACVAFLKPETYRKPVVLTSTVAWIAIAWMLAIRTPPSDRFVATFIDVGHGTSVLLQFPNGESWLYDAGRLGDAAFARWPIEAVLWSEGLRRLNGIVISHADADHYNAIPGLLERFSVDRIVGSHELFANTEPGMVELQIALASRNVPVDKIAAGETMLSMPDVRVEVLHPTTQHLIGKDNANSIVLKIDCFGHSLLLPGDLENPGTGILLAQSQPIAGGVLMAPHHGSLSQDIYPILRWSRPAAVVASGGERAIDPRVITGLSETGADAYITARDGTVRVQFDASGFHIRTWNHDPW